MNRYVHEDGLKLRRKVRAVVTNTTGQVLLIRPHDYPSHHWALPGGGVGAGESPVEAIRRNLAEKLGLDCAKLEQLPVRNRFVYSSAYKLKRGLSHDGQDAVMFFARVSQDCPLSIQTDAVSAARWFEPEAAAMAFPVAHQRTVFQECMVIAG